MPSINMIAPRRADKRRRERDMRRLVVVIIAELICAVGLGGWLFTRLVTTNNRVADLNTEIAKLKPVVKRIAEYGKAAKRLQPKLELLNEAKECTLQWYGALDRLTQSMPQSTYLTRVNSQADAEENSATRVSLNGISISQERIGEIMIRMHSIPEFESVDLHYTQNTAICGAPAIEFEIGAVMRSSESVKGARADAGAES